MGIIRNSFRRIRTKVISKFLFIKSSFYRHHNCTRIHVAKTANKSNEFLQISTLCQHFPFPTLIYLLFFNSSVKAFLRTTTLWVPTGHDSWKQYLQAKSSWERKQHGIVCFLVISTAQNATNSKSICTKDFSASSMSYLEDNGVERKLLWCNR